MTSIGIIKKDKYVTEVEVSGHSGYGCIGNDIVCAALSMATQMTLIGLDDIVHANFESLIDEKEARIVINVINEYKDKNVACLMWTLESALTTLAKQYPHYIQIHTRYI